MMSAGAHVSFDSTNTTSDVCLSRPFRASLPAVVWLRLGVGAWFCMPHCLWGGTCFYAEATHGPCKTHSHHQLLQRQQPRQAAWWGWESTPGSNPPCRAVPKHDIMLTVHLHHTCTPPHAPPPPPASSRHRDAPCAACTASRTRTCNSRPKRPPRPANSDLLGFAGPPMVCLPHKGRPAGRPIAWSSLRSAGPPMLGVASWGRHRGPAAQQP